MNRIGRIVMVSIASLLMIAFFAVPVVKLHEVDMIIVILVGIAMMIANFVEVVRGKED